MSYRRENIGINVSTVVKDVQMTIIFVQMKAKLLEVLNMRQQDAKNLGTTEKSISDCYLNLDTTTILWPNIHSLEHAIEVDT